MASHKTTKVNDDAADQPTMSVVDTNPEGMGSSDTEPDTELGATLDESASAEARPSVSVGTLQPLVDGLNDLAAPSGAPPAAPPPRAGMAPTTTPLSESSLGELSARYEAGAERRRHARVDDLNGLAAPSGAPPAAPPPRAGMAPTTTTTPLAQPSFEEISARYAEGAERRRHQHMGDHLIAAEQIGQLRAQLDQASIANAALTEQFVAKVAATNAAVADLTQRLAVSSAATEAALANGDPRRGKSC